MGKTLLKSSLGQISALGSSWRFLTGYCCSLIRQFSVCATHIFRTDSGLEWTVSVNRFVERIGLAWLHTRMWICYARQQISLFSSYC
jgi:hypothetical protein